MLSLSSVRWSELQTAYGSAADIPALLSQLSNAPPSDGKSEPWFSLWSALAHQGDVYSASFAAVPHVVDALAIAPNSVDFSYFQFPAWVEICRHKKQVRIPDELKEAYEAALARLPAIVSSASSREWDSGFLCCALSAVAAAKGHALVAESILELTPDVAKEFMDWFSNR
jgi:hypothetical protein